MNQVDFIELPFYRQLTPISCGPCVLRMGVEWLTGVKLPWRDAWGLTDCWSQRGVAGSTLKKAFKECGVKAQVRSTIRTGLYAVGLESRQHWILVQAWGQYGAVADPSRGISVMKMKRL